MADLTSDSLCNICCIHYDDGLRCVALGTDLTSTHGGWLFAKEGRSAWIVAPAASQVSRTWYLRDDAVTEAQNAHGCGDWFVPSITDLMLGLSCKSFLNSFSNTCYWTSTEYNTLNACVVAFNNSLGNCINGKGLTRCVRAFRRVFY
jgi:hypothetical protein